ncbi:MAG: MBL fold metallo-hydrolase [Clostridiales bacterium]|nr:MBL fold metallo-hydrolase [Clostridiales bacterium]
MTLPFVKYVIAACTVATVIYIFIKKADKRFILLIGLAGVIAAGIGFAVTDACSRGDTDMIYSRLGTNESIVVKSEGNVIAFDISNGSRASLMMAQSGAESLSGGQIDYLVLTHLHSNHISSVSKLCGNIKVKNLLIPSAQNESDAAVIRGLRDAVGDDVDISFYNRSSESSLLCGELSVKLPTYRILKRSTHPVIVFEFEQGGHKVLYFGASALDDADDALCEALSCCECAIVGTHGPKTKEPVLTDYFSAPTVICESGEAIIGSEKSIFDPLDYESGIHIRFTDK